MFDRLAIACAWLIALAFPAQAQLVLDLSASNVVVMPDALASGDSMGRLKLDYDGTATGNTYRYAGGTLELFTRYGYNATASGTVRALGSGVHVSSLSNGVSGRSEVQGAAFYVQAKPTGLIENGANFWGIESTVGGVVGDGTVYDGMLAGGVIMVQKRSGGRPVGAEYSGAGGLFVGTRPGATGFSPYGITADTPNFPLDVGVQVAGWSGDPAVMGYGDGTSAGAQVGFLRGFMAGGSRAGPWFAPTDRSCIGVAFTATDYVFAGLEIFGRHPAAATTAPAVHVFADAGPSVFGFDVVSDGATPLQAGGGPGQWTAGLRIVPVTHATSRRASIVLDGWTLGQDSAGNGTKDFFIYGPGGMRLFITSLSVIVPGLPTSATGLPSGALWRDGTTLRIVP